MSRKDDHVHDQTGQLQCWLAGCVRCGTGSRTGAAVSSGTSFNWRILNLFVRPCT